MMEGRFAATRLTGVELQEGVANGIRKQRHVVAWLQVEYTRCSSFTRCTRGSI